MRVVVTARTRNVMHIILKENDMRLIHGMLTHEFFLFPTVRCDDQYFAKYFEFDWLMFYFGFVIYNDDED